MDEDTGAYGGYAIVDFKREAVQAGITPPSVAGEISVSMLGTVAMLRVVSPAGDDDEWAPTLVAHIKHTDEKGVAEYLAKPRGRRPIRMAHAGNNAEGD
jgi:hypothetical protein